MFSIWFSTLRTAYLTLMKIICYAASKQNVSMTTEQLNKRLRTHQHIQQRTGRTGQPVLFRRRLPHHIYTF